MIRNLAAIRKKQGLTQTQLSELSKVPRVCISRYETKRFDPGTDNLLKLAAALRVTVDELIGKEDAS